MPVDKNKIRVFLSESQKTGRKTTQAELAEAAGITQPSIAAILSGKTKNPSTNVLQAIAAYFSEKLDRAILTDILTPPGWLIRAIQQDWRLEQGDGMASQRDSAPAPLPDTAAEIRQEMEQLDTTRLSPEEVRKMVAGVFGEGPTEAAQARPFGAKPPERLWK